MPPMGPTRACRFPPLPHFAAAALAALFLSVLALPAAAGVYEVRGVTVDVTAETAAAAREQALAQGERAAFERLMRRLVLRSDWPRLPEFGRRQIAGYVRDFAVAEEKTSTVRYIARLDYQFKPAEVRRLLTDNGFAFAETPSKPVVVVPVYRVAGALLLWDDPNPWRDAWRALPPSEGLVPLVVPLGDLSDIAAIGAGQALHGDEVRLRALASRYGAGDSLAAVATLRVGATPDRPDLEVYVTRMGKTSRQQTVVETFSPKPGEATGALLQRAAAEVAAQVEDSWKRDNMLQFGEENVMAVAVPIRGLAAWLRINKQLTGVAVIRRIEPVLMSRDEVRVNLFFMGGADQLVVALEQADLSLINESGEWVLRTLRTGGGGGT